MAVVEQPTQSNLESLFKKYLGSPARKASPMRSQRKTGVVFDLSLAEPKSVLANIRETLKTTTTNTGKPDAYT